MKEVLTKRFWQDVKKTFNEALEESPPAAPDPKRLDTPGAEPQAPAVVQADAPSPEEVPTSPEGSSKQC